MQFVFNLDHLPMEELEILLKLETDEKLRLDTEMRARSKEQTEQEATKLSIDIERRRTEHLSELRKLFEFYTKQEKDVPDWLEPAMKDAALLPKPSTEGA